MSRCTDTSVGDLLHAWELNLLSEEQNRAVEIHLIECPVCQETASSFTKAARLLRESRKVREEAKKAGKQFSPVMLRSLLAAVIVLGIGLPVYMYWSTPTDLAPGQQLTFYPVRSGEDRTIDLAIEGGVEFIFLAPETGSGGEFTLAVESYQGVEIYREDGFSAINERGAGSITLPSGDFTTGAYRLHIITVEDDTTTYGFHAE